VAGGKDPGTIEGWGWMSVLKKISERIQLSPSDLSCFRTYVPLVLVEIYGVETRRLNEQVKRNPDRFPEDFMFQLTREEADFWARSRSQIAILKRGKNIKYLPYAFTEHGTIMAANVLNSPQAVRMSVFVVRAFVMLREMIATHKELAHKLAELERKLQNHDESIRSLVVAIRQLMRPPEPEPPKKRIGFLVEEPYVPYKSSKGFKKQKRQ
jgi:hypothetical protein